MSTHIADRSLHTLLRLVQDLAGRSPRLRSVLDATKNRGEFSSLGAHEQMLADAVRVNAYRAAIEARVGPGDVVVDLGTGTGILAFFAARSGAAEVYAVDHSDFIEVAAEVARHNGLDNIEFVRCNSRDFTLDRPADVILHEQLDDHLFGEGMLGNLLDLKERVLAPSGAILPGRFDLFIEPVSLTADQPRHLWESEICDIDFACLKGSPLLTRYQRATYDCPTVRGAHIAAVLGEPAPVLSIDLDEMTSVDEVPTRLSATRRIAAPGTIDGFCVWFAVDLGAGITFDTAPTSPATHWANRLFRVERLPVRAGDDVSYQVDIGDLDLIETWTLSLR